MIKIFHFLFFSFLESRSDENLPSQVLFQYSHGKFDYFNVVFRLRPSAITRFKSNRKSWVQSRAIGSDVICALQAKQTWLIVYAILEK